MHTVDEMISSHPDQLDDIDPHLLSACIEECFACASACTTCADACLGESMVAELATCIRLDMDCADVCEATGRVMARHAGHDLALTRALLEACAAACRACAEECERHGSMEHCRLCAEACRSCEAACRDFLAALA